MQFYDLCKKSYLSCQSLWIYNKKYHTNNDKSKIKIEIEIEKTKK